ncbi:ATP-binding protein [uncultured Clostridium sp.]|uniref:ATP-binding protein n=1 Tax=uncultured Clostridium sp. TaxID=59620 RepID=UPI0025E938E9|nr:ATP-binding protein [uncultured Clostridium sp.]
MFGISSLGKDNVVRKSITRKYKNARITILDAKYKKVDGHDILLDEEKVDKLFSDVNRACEANSSRYNPSSKRILIANDESKIEELMNKEEKEDLKETVFNDEFMDVYEPRYSLEDVYIEEKEKKQIITALNIKKYENVIYRQWGFKDSYGSNRPVIFNFFGAPGTGKSMAAEAVGKYLGKKIYSINYANLESKYVGQTPKNIKKAFEKASADDAILVFEEADSFLGKRLTNITQSADYGVNITRSVMLLELEKFSGVVIFTTNLLENYDEAFKRRILASVEFKIPDEKGRKAIFDVHIPEKLPLEEGVDSEVLAKEFTKVSGADIKDIIFMAAVNAIERAEKEKNDKQEELIKSVVYDEKEAEEKSEEDFVGESEELPDLFLDSEDDEIAEKTAAKLIVINAEKEIAAEEDEDSKKDECEFTETENDNNEADREAVCEEKHHISAFTKAEEPEENGIDTIVTMEDFREAYRNIKNRYVFR